MTTRLFAFLSLCCVACLLAQPAFSQTLQPLARVPGEVVEQPPIDDEVKDEGKTDESNEDESDVVESVVGEGAAAETADEQTSKVPQVPPTRVEGSRKPVEPPAEQPLQSDEELQEKRLDTYLQKQQGMLRQPLFLEEVSRGDSAFLHRRTLIDLDGSWERQWVLGDHVVPGASGQLNPEQLHDLAVTMARYDLAAQPRLAQPKQSRFSRDVPYESVRLQFGQQSWQTERLFAEAKLETDPQKASPQDRLVLVIEQIRKSTPVKNGFVHPIGTVPRPYDQINSRRLPRPSGSRQLNGSP